MSLISSSSLAPIRPSSRWFYSNFEGKSHGADGLYLSFHKTIKWVMYLFTISMLVLKDSKLRGEKKT